MSAEPIQPTTIQALLDPVPKAYALLAGLQLDLFTALQDGPRRMDELARVVGGDSRRLSALLYFLVEAGLLMVSDGYFANTPEADRYLVRGRPDSFATGVDFWTDLWSAYATIAASIRAGHALAAHDYPAMAPSELARFYRATTRETYLKGEWLARNFDFSTCRSPADVGGGAGGVAVAISERHPQVQATVVDLPSAVPLTEQLIREAGAAGRVQVLAADLRAGPIPGAYDAAVLSHVVQLFPPEEAGMVLRHVAASLAPGGTLFLFGFVIADDRSGPPGAWWFDFAAIGYYELGRSHTETQYRTWLEDAGFGEIEVRWDQPPEAGPTLIVARKRR